MSPSSRSSLSIAAYASCNANPERRACSRRWSSSFTMTPRPSARKTAAPRSQRMRRLQPRQLLAHEVAFVQQRPGGRRQLVEPVHDRVGHRGNRRHRLAHLRQHAQPLPVARAPGERVALDVSREANPRRQHDVRVLPRRVQPTDAAVRKQREIDRHSITRIWSRKSAASSNCSLSIARRSRSRSSPSAGDALQRLAPSAGDTRGRRAGGSRARDAAARELPPRSCV